MTYVSSLSKHRKPTSLIPRHRTLPLPPPNNSKEPPPLRSGDLRPIPASQVFEFGTILVLAGRAAHLEAVRQPTNGFLVHTGEG